VIEKYEFVVLYRQRFFSTRKLQTILGPFQVGISDSVPGIKRLELEADISTPSSVEWKDQWRLTSTHSVRLHKVHLNVIILYPVNNDR
jgi:hypothetical protein